MTEKLLKIFLIILAIYLIGDGAIHLFNLKLQSVLNIWPASAISYATLLNTIYASFIFLAGLLLLTALKDLKKYKDLISASGIWAIFHACLLIYLVLTQNFVINFAPYPSLAVWMGFYNYYLLFEAGLAIVYSVLVFIWIKHL